VAENLKGDYRYHGTSISADRSRMPWLYLSKYLCSDIIYSKSVVGRTVRRTVLDRDRWGQVEAGRHKKVPPAKTEAVQTLLQEVGSTSVKTSWSSKQLFSRTFVCWSVLKTRRWPKRGVFFLKRHRKKRFCFLNTTVNRNRNWGSKNWKSSVLGVA